MSSGRRRRGGWSGEGSKGARGSYALMSGPDNGKLAFFLGYAHAGTGFNMLLLQTNSRRQWCSVSSTEANTCFFCSLSVPICCPPLLLMICCFTLSPQFLKHCRRRRVQSHSNSDTVRYLLCHYARRHYRRTLSTCLACPRLTMLYVP